MNLYSLGGDELCVLLATANTLVIVDSSELDVAFVAPRTTPGVSNDPVILSVLGTIADHSNGVIDVGWAIGFNINDTASVHRENVIASGKSD